MVQITEITDSQTTHDLPLPKNPPADAKQFKGRKTGCATPKMPSLGRERRFSDEFRADLPKETIKNRDNPQAVDPKLQRRSSYPSNEHQNAHEKLDGQTASMDRLTQDELMEEGDKRFAEYQKAWDNHSNVSLANNALKALKPFCIACENSENSGLPLIDLLKQVNSEVSTELKVKIKIGEKEFSLIPPDKSIPIDEAKKYYSIAVKAMSRYQVSGAEDVDGAVDIQKELSRADYILQRSGALLGEMIMALSKKEVENPWADRLKTMHERQATINVYCSDYEVSASRVSDDQDQLNLNKPNGPKVAQPKQ